MRYTDRAPLPLWEELVADALREDDYRRYLSESGVTADAFATACLIMGSKDAAEFYKSNDGFEIIMVSVDGQVQASKGIVDSIVFSDSDFEVKVIEK